MSALRKTRAPDEIRSLDSLRDHLQTALEIEHATIPPYFTAWMSVPYNTNVEAAEIIRSVMLEEMLHLTLAANLLNAVGGRPSLTYKSFVPRYPHTLPHSGNTFEVSIERLSESALRTFMLIEKPEARGAKPEADEWETIGQFYAAIREGIEWLSEQERHGGEKVFVGNASLQIRPSDYYGSGSVIEVTDECSALKAIEEIVEQGEGAHEGIFDGDASIFEDDGEEVAHYYRFNEVLQGRRYRKSDTASSGPRGKRIKVDYDLVFPMRSNTHVDDYPEGSELRGALERFSALYGDLLTSLEAAFTGERERLSEAMAQMFALRDEALALMRTPTGKGDEAVGLAFDPQFSKKRPKQ